jgi:iron complex outermembrane receptor protein
MKRVFASAVAVALLASGASAQDGGDPAPLQAQEGEQTRRDFQIPAQPLSGALNVFGRQSGFQVTIDSAIAAGVQSPGVSGTMTPAEAIARLLAGTGIVGRFSGGRTVVLTRASGSMAPGAIQLDPVQVQGYPVPSQAMIDNLPPPYAGGQVATGGQLGVLGNRSVMDTPFNQTSYTAKKAEDQQAKTVRDVLIDDPSVRAVFPNGGLGADDVIIRGFQVANSNISYGGLYGMLPLATIMAELAERVEVLKGPSAMLNGMQPGQALGGTINIVPKRAPDEALTAATANYVSGTQFGGHVDAARRFGSEKQFGVRMNGVFRAGETDVAWNTDKRALAAISLDFRGERVRLAADLGYQAQYVGGVVPFLGLANGVPLPWAPDARKNPGQPWGYTDRKDLFGVVRGEVDITERITAYASFGAHDARFDQMAAATVIASNVFGAATATPLTQSAYNTWLTGNAGVRALVDTGPIGHELAFVASTYSQTTGNAAVLGTAYATNIYASNIIARPNIPMPAANKTSVSTLSGISVADTLSAVDKRIQLTAGARFQQVGAQNYNPLSGAETSSYNQSAISPAVALVFKPWENVSIYGNFIQGLEQGDTVGTNFANAGTVFPPYKTTQYEAGVKVDWGRLTTTASVFQISRPSTITDVATNTLVLAGERRNRGLELNVFGELADGARLLGGVMFLESVLTKTQNGATDGWIAPLSPAAQFNLAGEWDVPFAPGLTLSSRIIYTGSQYIDTTTPRRMLPEWTRFDLGARFTFDNAMSPTGNPIVIRFNVENVLDNDYWAAGSSATLSLGAPRTFRVALTSLF